MSHDSALLTAQLLADGYCIVPNTCAAGTIAALNRDSDQQFQTTPFCEGDF